MAFWGVFLDYPRIYGGNIWLIHPIRSQMLYPLSYVGDLGTPDLSEPRTGGRIIPWARYFDWSDAPIAAIDWGELYL